MRKHCRVTQYINKVASSFNLRSNFMQDNYQIIIDIFVKIGYYINKYKYVYMAIVSKEDIRWTRLKKQQNYLKL